jgi:hypothetical protein
VSRQHGHITGYYLEYENMKKFYVVSGNHRVAALCHLFPERKIPAMFDRKEFLKTRDTENTDLLERYDNLFSDKNVDNWPSVKSGFIKKETALSILKRYVHG